MSKQCTKCKEYKPLSEYPRSSTCVDGYRSYCLICKNKQTMSYYYINKDKHRQKTKAWAEANPERVKDIKKKWKINNPLQVKTDRARRSALQRSASVGWDIELTEFAFEEAHHLRGLRDMMFPFKWHVDHVIPLRGKHVCGLHVYNNFAVIPAIVNMRKNNKYAISEERCSPV